MEMTTHSSRCGTHRPDRSANLKVPSHSETGTNMAVGTKLQIPVSYRYISVPTPPPIQSASDYALHIHVHVTCRLCPRDKVRPHQVTAAFFPYKTELAALTSGELKPTTYCLLLDAQPTELPHTCACTHT